MTVAGPLVEAVSVIDVLERSLAIPKSINIWFLLKNYG